MNNRLMSDTKEVKIEDVAFTIGIISKRKWFSIKSALQDLLAFGWGPYVVKLPQSEKEGKEDGEITYAALQLMPPDERTRIQNAMFENNWQMLKLGIKGHSGLKGPDGGEIPVKFDKNGLISDEIIDLYFDREYFTKLTGEVASFQSVSDDDKKN